MCVQKSVLQMWWWCWWSWLFIMMCKLPRFWLKRSVCLHQDSLSPLLTLSINKNKNTSERKRESGQVHFDEANLLLVPTIIVIVTRVKVSVNLIIVNQQVDTRKNIQEQKKASEKYNKELQKKSWESLPNPNCEVILTTWEYQEMLLAI